MNKDIKALNDQIAALEVLREALIKNVQIKCRHTQVAECEYESMGYGSSIPPTRVCENCGISEDGWGSGYYVLDSDKVRDVSRDELMEMQMGLRISDSEKAALRRGEVTLRQLIRENA